ITPGQTLTANRRQWLLICLGLFGAALLYGDGMITPAISVLSAVEGLRIATPIFDPYVIPITVAILLILFLLQRRGTAGVGTMFGPVMVVWFLTMGALGLWHTIQHPQVLLAANPLRGLSFFLREPTEGFLALGSVFLVVTGSESLYADLGHFGPGPIRQCWFSLVLPALMINYLGQGAVILQHPEAVTHPFFHMAPAWALYPLVILAATAATIASQAVISGAFSLTMQAVQLGYSPRMIIDHTSPTEPGQIYLPVVNWALMIACIGLVIGFGSSSRLAGAYGMAVTTTMVITTLLFFVLVRRRWQWGLPLALAVCGTFFVIDLSFFGANALKIAHGGWFPLIVAAIAFLLLTTWKRGREILGKQLAAVAVPLERFQEAVRRDRPPRVPGTAVFMQGNPRGTPVALLHNLKHHKVLHERVVLLTVITEDIPHVPAQDRLQVTDLGDGFYRMVIRYGFMQDPDVPRDMKRAQAAGLTLEPLQTTYFLGRETLIVTRKPGMASWRKMLFAWMSRNAHSATAFFRLPANRVVELGVQVEL
ncbi:MAG TPA: KUP/HAK/KT family potassium transporter, partial [Phycisphaeraceae bacterium]